MKGWVDPNPERPWTCGICQNAVWADYDAVQRHWTLAHPRERMLTMSVAHVVNKYTPLENDGTIHVPLNGHPYEGAQAMKGIVGDRDAVLYKLTFGNWQIQVGRNNDTFGSDEEFMFCAEDGIDESVMMEILFRWDGYGQPLGWYRHKYKGHETKRAERVVRDELHDQLWGTQIERPPHPRSDGAETVQPGP